MPRDDNTILIFSDKVLILNFSRVNEEKVKELVKRLRELGLDFEEKIYWCG